MPTSSVAGFVRSGDPDSVGTGSGGAEASLGCSQVPWRAAVGKRVRLVCSGPSLRRRSVAGFARNMGEVAIGASPSRVASYSPFVRYVKNYYSLYIRLFRESRPPWKPRT